MHPRLVRLHLPILCSREHRLGKNRILLESGALPAGQLIGIKRHHRERAGLKPLRSLSGVGHSPHFEVGQIPMRLAQHETILLPLHWRGARIKLDPSQLVHANP